MLPSPDGRHAYVRIDGGIAVFARDGDTGWLEFASAVREGEEGFTGIEGRVLGSPDGAFLYVIRAGSIAILARDPDTGALTQVDLLEDEDLGEGPDAGRALHTAVMSGDGQHFYAFAHERSTALGYLVLPLVLTFERDATTGALTLLDEDPLEEPTPSSFGVYNAVASPDGATLWAELDGIAAFARDALSGSLSAPQLAYDQPPHPLARLLPSPDGRHLYMTAGWERGIWTYGIGEDDTLAFLDFVEDGAGPSPLPEYCRTLCEPPEALAQLRLVFDATGGRLYGTTNQPSAVVAFARDPDIGTLTVLEVYDGDEIPDGLASGRGIGLSPDGRHLYVSGGGADPAILVFAVPEPGAAALGAAALAALAALRGASSARARGRRAGRRPGSTPG